MIDERHEELAALYVLDLLEGAERAQFETALARDPSLQALVRELRESSAALAHTAPAVPPPSDLRARVMASVGGATAPAAAPDNVVRPPASVFRTLLPWAAAAGFALAAAGLGSLYLTSRQQNELLRQQQALADLTLKAAQTALESERVVSQGQLATINDTARRLADATQRGTTLDAQRLAAERALAEARTQTADRERQLAGLQGEAAERDRQLATLRQRAEALVRATQDIERQFTAAQDQLARLDRELKDQAALSDLKITTLASMLKNTPQALAVAVWDPKKQEGVLKFAKLPALAANQDYQLWVVDPQYPNPVDGGLLTIDPVTGEGTITFKPKQPVRSIDAFAVTRERKGGVPKAEGPFILLGK
jgi:anti-sigma-K factor RskA